MTSPTGRKAERDDARAVLLDTDGDQLAEYLGWDDALGAAKLPALLTEIIAHPSLTPALAEPPAREPATPPLSAVVKSIIDAHYTHGMSLDARVAKYPIVVDGDVSTPAIHAYFLSLVSKKEQTTLKNRTGTSSRDVAIESMIDADTRAEPLHCWLSAS